MQAALSAGYLPSLILGPLHIPIPQGVQRLDVQTAAEMHRAVLQEFPRFDALIMAAAVADYRPKSGQTEKMKRGGALALELEPTPDIVAAASEIKRPDQRTVGFSLESPGNIQRSREKLQRKNLDLIVYNPIATMNSDSIESVLIWRDGREESLARQSKSAFADHLIRRVAELFG